MGHRGGLHTIEVGSSPQVSFITAHVTQFETAAHIAEHVWSK